MKLFQIWRSYQYLIFLLSFWNKLLPETCIYYKLQYLIPFFVSAFIGKANCSQPQARKQWQGSRWSTYTSLGNCRWPATPFDHSQVYGESEESQAYQSDPGTREGHGADHLECHLTAHRKNQVSRCNHHVFMEYRSCLTDLISFCSKDDREAIHAVYIDFSKELDTFPQYSPGKTWLLKAWTGLHCCVKNWLYSQAQRVLVTGD